MQLWNGTHLSSAIDQSSDRETDMHLKIECDRGHCETGFAGSGIFIIKLWLLCKSVVSTKYKYNPIITPQIHL